MDELVTIAEAASVARCSYTKMYALARSGELPFKKLGSTWLIPRSRLFSELGLADPGLPPYDHETKKGRAQSQQELAQPKSENPTRRSIHA